jgi:DNA-binding beta-propeller fold protein YncE
MPGKKTAIAGVAIIVAGCGGNSSPAATVTATATTTQTVTVTFTPPPPPGPKTTINSNGTYLVNTDIAAGTYRTDGGPNCYWARLKSLNTNDIIDNNVSDGPQVVAILPTDAAFITRACGVWQRS